MSGNTFHRHDAEPHFWVGHLAGRIRDALQSPEQARSILTAVLRQLRESPCCTPELDAALSDTPRKTVRPVPDEPADWGEFWKPCLNPECRMPLSRKSSKDYCDGFCRKIAFEYDQARYVTDQTDSPPF